MGRLSRVDWTETSCCWVVFLGDPGRWVELVVCSAQHMENRGFTLEWASCSKYGLQCIFFFFFKISPQPLTCTDQIIPVQPSQYHRCWCPGSFSRSSAAMILTMYNKWVGSCLIWGRISTTCVKSVWKNDMNYRYIFMFLMKKIST